MLDGLDKQDSYVFFVYVYVYVQIFIMEKTTMSSFLLGLEDFGYTYPTKQANTFGIKFIYQKEIARKIYKLFSSEYPELKAGLMFHEPANKNLIILGGCFPSNSKAKDIFYRLYDRCKA
jgi:hypothetical protein